MGPFNKYETLDIAFLNPFPPYITFHSDKSIFTCPLPFLVSKNFSKDNFNLESECRSTYVCTGNTVKPLKTDIP